jgi:hypothetical protein
MGKTLILSHNAEFIILNFIDICNPLSKIHLVWGFMSGQSGTPVIEFVIPRVTHHLSWFILGEIFILAQCYMFYAEFHGNM